MPCLVSPQVFVYHLLSINYIPFSLQTSYNDSVCFLPASSRLVEKRDGSNVGGTSTFAPHCNSFIFPPLPQWNHPPWTASRLGGEAEGLPWHCLPVGTSWGGSYRGQEIWSIDCMGKPLSGQGALHGGSSWETDCLGLQWTQLTLCLGAVTQGHLPCTTPWGEALGHPTSKRGRETTPYRQISQLEVCQLLISGPQATYPIGLNGCEEPIITSLPESLANGVSLTRGKSVYLEIDILQSLAEELDWKVLPIGKLSTTMIASPHKSTPQNQKERTAWPWR